jgi:hypothetical protein
VGIFRASAPLGAQQSHQKIPSPKKGIYSTHDDPHTKKDGICHQNLPPLGILGKMKKSHNGGISHIILGDFWLVIYRVWYYYSAPINCLAGKIYFFSSYDSSRRLPRERQKRGVSVNSLFIFGTCV